MFNNFAEDNQGSNAVIVNGSSLASFLGYRGGEPENTPVERVAICNMMGRGKIFEVKEGSYNSATFADYCRALKSEEYERTGLVTIDDRVLAEMESFMGQTVMRQSRDENSGKHSFVRAMLASKGGKISLAIAR